MGEKMTSATTNWATPASVELLYVSDEPRYVASNRSVRVGGMNEWQRKAIGKVLEYKWQLNSNWDSYESNPISEWVTCAATKLVEKVPFDNVPAPRVVPVSGGGIQMEWSKGHRDLEIYFRPDRTIEILKIVDGVPLNDGEGLTSINLGVESIFSWLNAA